MKEAKSKATKELADSSWQIAIEIKATLYAILYSLFWLLDNGAPRLPFLE